MDIYLDDDSADQLLARLLRTAGHHGRSIGSDLVFWFFAVQKTKQPNLSAPGKLGKGGPCVTRRNLSLGGAIGGQPTFVKHEPELCSWVTARSTREGAAIGASQLSRTKQWWTGPDFYTPALDAANGLNLVDSSSRRHRANPQLAVREQRSDRCRAESPFCPASRRSLRASLFPVCLTQPQRKLEKVLHPLIVRECPDSSSPIFCLGTTRRLKFVCESCKLRLENFHTRF